MADVDELVGAPGDDSATLYVLSGLSWTTSTKYTAVGQEVGRFGEAVALNVSAAFIGAPEADEMHTNLGVVLAYDISGQIVSVPGSGVIGLIALTVALVLLSATALDASRSSEKRRNSEGIRWPVATPPRLAWDPSGSTLTVLDRSMT